MLAKLKPLTSLLQLSMSPRHDEQVKGHTGFVRKRAFEALLMPPRALFTLLAIFPASVPMSVGGYVTGATRRDRRGRAAWETMRNARIGATTVRRRSYCVSGWRTRAQLEVQLEVQLEAGRAAGGRQ